MYAALMTHGCSLSQFNSLIDGLVAAKMVRKDGNCLFAG